MLQFALFDLGGVLFDFDHRIASRALAARSRLADEEIHRLVFDDGLEQAYDLGEISTREFVADLERRAGYRGTVDDFRKDWGEIFVPRLESWAIVDRLVRSGLPLGVVSNTNEAHFEVLDRMTDFPSRFRWLFLSFRLRCRKPETRFYDAVTSRIPFSPGEGIFIDDRAENLRAAAQAGFRTHLFFDDKGLDEALAEV